MTENNQELNAAPMTHDKLRAKIEALEKLMLDPVPVEWLLNQYRAQLAALGPETEAETGAHKLFVWTDHCIFAAVAHAKTVAQARELIEGEDLGGHDGSCPERVAARKMIYGETPGIYRGGQAVLMFDTGKPEQPWTPRERRLRELIERGAALAEEALDPLWMANNGFTDAEDALYTWKDAEVPAALADTPPPDARDEAMENLVAAAETFVAEMSVSAERELLAAIRAARGGK